MTSRLMRLALATFILGVATISGAKAEEKFIIVQSTTSTQNSGLFDHILPAFRNGTGIDVRVVAVGTGQPIQMVVAVQRVVAVLADEGIKMIAAHQNVVSSRTIDGIRAARADHVLHVEKDVPPGE